MMKGFKLLIVGLCSLFSLIGFGYCLDYTNGYVSGFSNQYGISNSGYLCFYVDGGNTYGDNGSANVGYNCGNGGCNDWSQFNYKTFKSCIYIEGGEIVNNYNPPSQGTLYYGFFPPYQECNVNNPYTSLECQTEYNLIPVENVDINYCVGNQLCPACELSGGLSELFINEIQHNSAPLINITIPEEFDWDYSGSDEEFDLEVKGYNVDTEYVDGLIRSQNFKPNSDDFSSILTGLVPLFVPGLAIILFLYFVFRFVKKVF